MISFGHGRPFACHFLHLEQTREAAALVCFDVMGILGRYTLQSPAKREMLQCRLKAYVRVLSVVGTMPVEVAHDAWCIGVVPVPGPQSDADSKVA